MKSTVAYRRRALQILTMFFGVLVFSKSNAQLISTTTAALNLANADICIDSTDYPLVKKSAQLLQQDIEMVTGKKPAIVYEFGKSNQNLIVIGSTGSSLIKKLENEKLLNLQSIAGKWEAFQLQTIGAGKADIPSRHLLVIAGSDRRGAAFGVFELSRQMGVSPWYWWADVPVKKQAAAYVNTAVKITDAPKVKYRGFFINDEAPCLSRWTKENFGGFTHSFYEKVFELLLRLKANYLWPAMWGNAFNADDTLNPVKADEYGIVMGTSHHEPMLRAQQEWKKFGQGAWDYTKNDTVLRAFWKAGIENMKSHESIVTIGMRGDGDMPMSRTTATELLEKIVTDQRKIIEETTQKPAAATPQLWALYKEVQDYYDKGMRVPDDVTLLLCDDNWGNLRKLPGLNEPQRRGGYGIYYHFDYVGGPRNYKWINTNSIPRVWEQMHLAYEYNVRNIWIVNVGDIKPLEFPISFFLDYAWNPEKIGAADLQKYTEQWSAAQFGTAYAKDVAAIISTYSKYNSRRKPEMLDANTYSIDHYNEFANIAASYKQLVLKAENMGKKLPGRYASAYYQLVQFPVQASANINNMYYHAALNRKFFEQGSMVAANYADTVKQLYEKDSLLTLQYHAVNNGKWNHMMDQTHIGYRIWQEPRVNKMPEVKYPGKDSAITIADKSKMTMPQSMTIKPSATKNKPGRFICEQDKCIAVEADHFTRAINSHDITWQVLPDHGKTGAALTPFPVTAKAQTPDGNAPHVEYDFYTTSSGPFTMNAYFSPTLNFHNTAQGLQYAISIDNEVPQIISINKEDKNTGAGVWNKWVGDNIIVKMNMHAIGQPGKHVLKYWMVDPCVVLQKLVMDFGGMKPCYLGPPETIVNSITTR